MSNKCSGFTPDIIQSLAYYLISNRKREMGNIELMKLFYLIDVEYYKLFGKTLTGLTYERYPKGPYSREIQNRISELDGFEIAISITPTCSSYPKKGHNLGVKPRFVPEFNGTDKSIIDHILDRAYKLNPLQLEKLAYDTEPMKHILELEKKAGETMIAMQLDFSLIRKNNLMEAWLKNKSKEAPRAIDRKYQDFLRDEKKELELILA